MAQQSTHGTTPASGASTPALDLAEHAEVKAPLAACIAGDIEAGDMTQAAAAALLGVDQPKVSRLVHGQLAGFSTPRLLRFLLLLGRDVDIVVHPPCHASLRRTGRLRVVADRRRV